MKLRTFSVRNFRSIVDSSEVQIADVQGLIGENNSGKSNFLYAIDAFLSAGAAGVTEESFFDKSKPIVMKSTFGELTESEKALWRSYLVSGELKLEKHFTLESDTRSGKVSVKTEFHGYRAEPKDWFLSVGKIEDRFQGKRISWAEIVDENKLPEYFKKDGKCNKGIYESALQRYLVENSVEYDEPDLSQTQALGIPSRVITSLPTFYLLKAITDYSDEIDKRSSSTTFRKLMATLSERIIERDPRYKQVETALKQVRSLLSTSAAGAGLEIQERLTSICDIEASITRLLKRLMPSVQSVLLNVAVDEIGEIFSRGVELTINDGVQTDVLAKGHGLQRCVVLSLLQALILSEREQLLSPSEPQEEPDSKRIILAIEEPELYIHPQLQKLLYDVMREFGKRDQVIYSTHSALFVDVYEYESISVVRKESANQGTKVFNCDTTAFDGIKDNDKKMYKGISRFNADTNELFFAKKVLLVEGSQDRIAVTETARAEGLIQFRTEEIDVSVIVAGGKDAIPSLQRILNAFKIPYRVLHDTDITEGMSQDDKCVQEKTNKTIETLAGKDNVVKFPIKLENTLRLPEGHLKDLYTAWVYFSDETNINAELRAIVKKALLGV